MGTIIFGVILGVGAAFGAGLVSRLTESNEQTRERRDLNEVAKDMLVAVRRREKR